MKRKTKEEEKSKRKLNKLGMKQDMKEFYEDEFKDLLSNPTGYCRTHLGCILPYLATQMVTAYHNNIKQHFMTRILRFVNRTTEDYEKRYYKGKQWKNGERTLSSVMHSERSAQKSSH